MAPNLSTPQFLKLTGKSEMALKNAVRRFRLPFSGTPGKMREWAEIDYLIWCVFDCLHLSGAKKCLRTASQIAELAIEDPSANLFFADKSGWWIGARPSTTAAEIQRVYKKHSDERYHLIFLDLQPYRKEYWDAVESYQKESKQQQASA